MTERFGLIPEGLLFRRDVSVEAKTFFAALWLLGLGANGHVTGSTPVLAERLGVAYITARRRLAELQKAGYVKRLTKVGQHVQVFQLFRSASDATLLTGEQAACSHEAHDTSLCIRESLELGADAPSQTISECVMPEDNRSEFQSGLDAFAEKAKIARGGRSLAQGEYKGAARRLNAARGRKNDLDEILDDTPVTEWTPSMVNRYYVQLYRNAYPQSSKMAFSAILNRKGLSQLAQLRDFLTRDDLEGEDAIREVIPRMVSLLDHVFDNRVRIADGLKLQGTLTPGVLLGFRDSLLADFTGTTRLGTKVAALGAATGEINGFDGFTSTSDTL